MKKIRVKYLDWWDGFEPEHYLISKLLEKHYYIDNNEMPDYTISSMYTKSALAYDGIRIFYTGENFSPDFNLFDYAIGFEKMNFGDRYIYCPNYIINPKYAEDVKQMQRKHTDEAISEKIKTEFCSFVVSNSAGNPIRFKFFEELLKYKKVNSGGRYMNNIGLQGGVPDKYEFQKKHKFSLCFENSSHLGYTTEKLVQGFAAGTIPIYWGASDVGEIFNKNAMVIIKDNNDFSRALKQIIEIDENDDIYRTMLKEPALVNPEYIQNTINELEKFLVNIFEQPIEHAYRRPIVPMVEAYYRKNNKNLNMESKNI